MTAKNDCFDVFPRLVRTEHTAVITIKPWFDHCRFSDGQAYRVTLIPALGLPGQTSRLDGQEVSLRPESGILQVACQFGGEQEYILLVETGEKEPVLLAEFRLYALADDLFARRPFKGDIHMHSFRSDGKESPAYVAGSCRKIGLDFMALTDHHQYEPSLEAIRSYEKVEVDLRIYPGEEVHAPDNPVHIVNFGGNFSVNELFQTDRYWDEVKAVEAALPDLPPGIDRYPYAACVWCFNKIREAGGLGLFCHPYWFSNHHYDVPEYLTDLIFERQPFDAVEVVGGYRRVEFESNALQVARYNDERARGKHLPAVGVSDAHGCSDGELFGWYYTVVFAPSLELADLIQSIKNLYSVAVESLPDQAVRAYGPLRLVKYAQFLLREIFPLHDELCLEEGRLMLANAAGEPGAAGGLHTLKGRVERLYLHLWEAADQM